jgi:hypothetical protein
MKQTFSEGDIHIHTIIKKDGIFTNLTKDNDVKQ